MCIRDRYMGMGLDDEEIREEQLFVPGPMLHGDVDYVAEPIFTYEDGEERLSELEEEDGMIPPPLPPAYTPRTEGDPELQPETDVVDQSPD
eukprot:TRINITY_DN2608_c0_g1_i2.p2 TRINITY_DN2608_c0_g1~~TRINITY_DN2608_c0_g1_i2.p2  ORF type:complete len:107 (+),score=36.00 TRINITY_DN2608_c0_g1_i2:49-321(+)